MKKNKDDDRLNLMSNRHLRYFTVAAASLILLLNGGCNALKRGDYLRQSDNTLYFSEIGFLMADNPGLSRDAMTVIEGFEQEIWITVPYSADTTSPLVLNYSVVGKDTTVEYENPPGSDTYIPLISGVTALTFNDGATPVEHRLRISKQNTPGSGSDSRDFIVHVDKIIQPVLYNPPSPGDISPFDDVTSPAFRFSFEDDEGNLITGLNAPGLDTSTVGWDSRRMEFVTNPAYDAGPPEGFVADVKIYYPGEHWISINSGMYTDSHGYTSIPAEIQFSYDPPPVYLSQSGNDSNNGLSASTPVKTWTRAYSIVKSTGIFDIYIEASDTPYDVEGDNVIDGNIKAVSIFGNWKPGFTGRYEEDMDNRTPTVLTNSLQNNGGSSSNPSAVLAFVSVTSDFVLDGVTLEPSKIISDGSALKIDNSDIKVSDCRFISPQESSTGATAVTVTNNSGNSSPQFYGTQIIGKVGGSGDSTGMGVYGSDVEFADSFIVAGDISGGNATGIYAESSNLHLHWSYILAGFIDPEDDVYTEQNNKGIISRNSNLDMDGILVHAADSSTLSEATGIIVEAGEGSPSAWIHMSTLVSGNSDTSTALYAHNADAGELYLFNSVLLAGRADVGSSTGIFNDKMEEFQVMENAIHVSRGTPAANSFGIRVTTVNAGNHPDIRNNLIWSTDSNQSLGVKLDEDYTTSPFPIKNNDFWNTSGPAQLDIGNGPENLAVIQAGNPTVFGNFGVPVDVDINLDYSNPDFSPEKMGRITGTVPPDVMFGGEDLSGLPSSPPDYDRTGRERTAEPGLMLGWSVGPFEYDNGSLPHIIYVSTSANGGDDSHPLGTKEAPYSSLARAYDIARLSNPRTDVTEIRIALGSYDLTTPNMTDINTGPDIRILGGYSYPSWSRNPEVNTTELRRDDGNPVLVFNSNSISRETILDGFTLSNNSNIADPGETLVISGGASPEIRNNLINGSNSANSYTVDITGTGSAPRLIGNKILGSTNSSSVGIYIEGQSNPEILANHIFSGTASNSDTGIYIDKSGANIFNNVIHAGEASAGSGDTYGIYFNSNDDSGANNPVRIFNNTILGGSTLLCVSAGANTTGIFSNDDNIFIKNNLLISGFPGTGNGYGINMQTDPPKEVSNNLILFGTPAANRHASMILTNTFDTPAGMENDLISTYSRIASGNLMDGTNNPDTYFIDYQPAMTAAGFLNENWRLSPSGAQNARTGGQDLSNYFNKDRDGKTRTVPWSIGAYEY